MTEHWRNLKIMNGKAGFHTYMLKLRSDVLGMVADLQTSSSVVMCIISWWPHSTAMAEAAQGHVVKSRFTDDSHHLSSSITVTIHMDVQLYEL